jgi:putative hydrolase of the HAD superfamily
LYPLVSSIRSVIFDVDGTLYDQRKLRRKISWEMLRFLVGHPTGLRDLKILWDFRKAREKNASLIDGNIEERQFEWGARASKVSVEKVRQVVQNWMFTRPLCHLDACCYPGVRELFSYLKEKSIPVGIFSDYPAQDKLQALNLEINVIVSATDLEVDRLKPDPKGLIFVASKLKTPVKECLFIGDRDDKDGECARRAGMPYLILNRKKRNCSSNSFNTFTPLESPGIYVGDAINIKPQFLVEGGVKAPPFLTGFTEIIEWFQRCAK